MQTGIKFFALCIAAVLATAALRANAQVAAPPLRTQGNLIVDSTGKAIRLTSVNWYGFDQKEYVAGGLDRAPLATIVEQIRRIGVSSVRLPWANETLEHNPVVADYAVAANPQFKGKRAMQVMDAVIAALGKARIMVILDNHMSRADWCCSETDDNELWYNAEYPETSWLRDWQTIVRRYKHEPWVVGADLRNELRSGATWGGADAKHDWHAAAERGGNAVLAANPRLLVMVEGPQYSTNFAGVDTLPVRLKVAGRLVYSPHAYAPEKPFSSYEEMEQAYAARVGMLMTMKDAAPIWVGEFGTCQKLDCGANSEWYGMFVRYLKAHSAVGWSYWPLNGTQSSGVTRTYNTLEDYGLLTMDYRGIAAPGIVESMKEIGATPEPR